MTDEENERARAISSKFKTLAEYDEDDVRSTIVIAGGIEVEVFVTPDGFIWHGADRGYKQLPRHFGNGRKPISVAVVANKKQTTFTAARLVAEAWVGNPNDCKWVVYKDDDKANLAADNIAWSDYTDVHRTNTVTGFPTAPKFKTLEEYPKEDMRSTVVTVDDQDVTLWATSDGFVWYDADRGHELLSRRVSKGVVRVIIVNKVARRKVFVLARLIAAAWLPNPDNLSWIVPIDRNKLNTAVSNLAWSASKSYTVGKKCGRLTIRGTFLGKPRASGRRVVMANCICDCGKSTNPILADVLAGTTQSCGCYMVDQVKRSNTKHGLEGNRIYTVYKNMKARCYDNNHKSYPRYGGRGITVCDEWLNNIHSFYSWAKKSGYEDNLTIDRIDNDKGYYPDNCRWATWTQQANNKSNNVQLSYQDKKYTIATLARHLNIPPRVLYKCHTSHDSFDTIEVRYSLPDQIIIL